jgi:hypothetical protein
MELWSDTEKQQLRRDVEALRARLARIPAERQQEVESIRQRYTGLMHRTFPVAIIVVVPQNFAGRRLRS